MISDGYNGVLVDFFSHEDLSNAVIDLLSARAFTNFGTCGSSDCRRSL